MITRSLAAAGILLRIALVVLVVPLVQVELFGPFLEHSLKHPTLDPWQSWLDAGGHVDAFPYGPVMALVALAGAAIGQMTGLPFGTELGLGFLALAAEGLIWWLTRHHVVSRAAKRNLTVMFAIAPIPLYAVYIHGQLDLIPTLFIISSVLAARSNRWGLAGLILGLAAAAKLSALLILPVAIVFLLRNNRFRKYTLRFVLGLLPGAVLAVGPVYWSGYRTMVFGAPQIESFLGFGIPLGQDFFLVLAPLVVVVATIATWRMRRSNTDIYLATVALLLALVPALVPVSPGWFLWGLPLLILVSADLQTRHRVIIMAVFTSTAAWSLLTSTWAFLRFSPWDVPTPHDAAALFGSPALSSLRNLAGTAMVAIAIFSVASIWTAARSRLDVYRLSRSPLSVAVTGDSGSGKDTICRLVGDAFPDSSTAYLLGDDYHLHERGSSHWRIRTHLDPSANALAAMTADFEKLLSNQSVWSRHYDHETGRFTQPRRIRAGDLIVANGLHVLSSSISQRADLSVFLDMDEALRTQLKMHRDVFERGHAPEQVLASIEKRANDRDRFIAPQESRADITLRIEPSHPLPAQYNPREGFRIPPTRVVANLKGFVLGQEFVRIFTSLVGVSARLTYLSPDISRIEVDDANAISSAAIASAALELLKRPEEITSHAPLWSGGSQGVSQLLVTLCLLEKRSRP
jgi:uridine kinase